MVFCLPPKGDEVRGRREEKITKDHNFTIEGEEKKGRPRG